MDSTTTPALRLRGGAQWLATTPVLGTPLVQRAQGSQRRPGHSAPCPDPWVRGKA